MGLAHCGESSPLCLWLRESHMIHLSWRLPGPLQQKAGGQSTKDSAFSVYPGGVHNQRSLLTVFAAFSIPVLLCFVMPFHIRRKNTKSTTCCILTSPKALWIGFYYFCFSFFILFYFCLSNKETEVQKGAVIWTCDFSDPRTVPCPLSTLHSQAECLVSAGSGWCFSC